PGDSIKVNFNPELNLETENRTALITTALPFAAFGNVSLVLFRPFDIDTKKHVDLEVSSLPYTFKTVDDIFQALQSHPAITVYATTSTLQKVLKLQLASLRKLQDNPELAKRRDFLLGRTLIPEATKDICNLLSEDSTAKLQLGKPSAS
ncbi:MAG: hypothetical protein Q9187_008898, partial [Circinaria calcarea]